MSIVGHLKQVGPNVLEDLIQEKLKVLEYIYPEDFGNISDLGIKSLYLDKSWHAIHYLLNEKAWEGKEPLVHVILGGKPIGEDLGNGPARYLTHNEVQRITAELLKLKGRKLTNRYNPRKMTLEDIYPSIDWDDEGTKQYIFDNYWSVVDYYKDAAEKGNGMLLYLT